MTSITLTEVPLITQEHLDGNNPQNQVRRFTIQNDLSIACSDFDSNSNFSRGDKQGHSHSQGDPFWDGNEDEWKDRMQGCAATHFAKKSQTLIRTAACVEEPYVLSIVKLNMNGNGDSNGKQAQNQKQKRLLSAVEIDVSRLDANHLGNVIKTLIFRKELLRLDGEMEVTKRVKVIEIQLIDTKANIICITLDYDTLLPIDPTTTSTVTATDNDNDASSVRAAHISTQAILSKQNIHPHSQTRYSLTSAQVTSLDANGNRLVLAISPFLLCLNLTTQKVAVWTKESCHYNRRKSLSRVFRSAKGMLVGSERVGEEEEEFVEDLDAVSASASGSSSASVMASTAALCVFDKVEEYSGGGYDLYDDDDDDDDDDGGGGLDEYGVSVNGKVVCSLHSDGTVRMWICGLRNQNFTYPRQMRVLYGEDIGQDGYKIGDGSTSTGTGTGTGIMPLPHLWSSSSDSLLIGGHSFMSGNKSSPQFVVMVGIRIAENTGVDRTSSPFHLSALGGDFNTAGGVVEKAKMAVPMQVDSLHAIDFVRPNHASASKGASTSTNAWELRALYSSIPARSLNDSGYFDLSMYASFSHAPLRETMMAIYQPNSAECIHVQTSNTCEKFAEDECEKIVHECNLMSLNGLPLGNNEDDNENDEDIDIDVALRQLDGWYLQRLFRSGSVQTVGLNRATNGAVRRAVRKVVPPLCLGNNFNKTDVKRSSIELETLTVMHSWSKFDETRSSADSRRRAANQMSTRSPVKATAPSSSVYSDFCNTSALHSPTPEIAEDSDDQMEFEETSSRERKIQEHHSKWKKLFLAVFDEEMKLLSPIGFSCLPPLSNNSESNLILRPGIISAMVLWKPTTNQLDSIVLSIFDRIENTKDSNNREILSWLEARVWQIVSKAKLLHDDEKYGLLSHVNTAISEISVDWERASSKLLIKLNTMSHSEVENWLLSPLPQSLLSELSILGSERSEGNDKSTNNASVIIPNATRLSKQYIAECQRLAMARYICVVGIGASGNTLFNHEQERVSLVTYLHTVAASWACAQICTSASKYGDEVKGTSSFGMKAMKGSITDQSILSLNLSRVLTSYGNAIVFGPIVPSTIKLSMEVVRSAVQKGNESYPELAIVPEDFPEDAARISLRLLSPLVAFPSLRPSSNSRSIKAADCLMSEISVLSKSGSIKNEKAKELLEHGSILLKSSVSVRSDLDSLRICLEALANQPDQISVTKTAADEIYKNAIIETIRDIFEISGIPVVGDDVYLLSRSEKFKELLLPWVIQSHQNGMKAVQLITERLSQYAVDAATLLAHVTYVMILVSKLVERVQVIEKHSEMLKSPKLREPFAKVMISAINDIIVTVQNHANSVDYTHLVEYPALWSALFRNALEGQCWDDAFESCLSNPLTERRISNLKRLVIAMADSGAWGLLLDKIIFFIVHGDNSTSDMDVYEMAAETLAEASHRAFSDNPSFLSPTGTDYRGCLFALHAAYGDWRRSCQAIDFFGALTLRRIPFDDDDPMSSSSLDKKANNEIMDELVLSAVSSAQLIGLVENPNLRYIVTGEIASMNEMKIDNSEESDTRTSRLYSDKELLLRAKRFISLLSLQRDAYSQEKLLDILNATDTSIIDALPRLGYFQHAIALSHCKQENKEGAKPRGRDLFVDAISHMLCKCLAPVAVSLTRSLAGDDDFVIEEEMKSRPTMHQLRLLTGNGRLPSSRDSWQQGGTVAMAERGACAMELLRLYTEAYATENNSIALDLAETLLDLDDSRALLPVWLTNIILGKSKSGCDGLFATNGGNPTALLNLYIRNGLYVEACNVVSDILRGGEGGRENAATSRLPERGNIDFVPYEAIDNLWNLIESYCQGSANPDQKARILNARFIMQNAIEKHFKLMQISEQGLLSARALKGR